MQIFGVRHLSPAAAWHLREYLDRQKPKAVLVEAPSDFNPLIPELTADGVVPPVAMLGYTRSAPVQTVLYPFAIYSPEYQALKWARENGVEARFIDLPSSHMIGLRNLYQQQLDDTDEDSDFTGDDEDFNIDGDAEESDSEDFDDSGDDRDEGVGNDETGEREGIDGNGKASANAERLDEQAEHLDKNAERLDEQSDLENPDQVTPQIISLQQQARAQLAEQAGAPDYETWWERSIEHHLKTDDYRQAMLELGQGLRELEAKTPDADFAENLLRESHMRREARRCMQDLSLSSDEVVLVVGAFHAGNLLNDDDCMTDEQLQALPDDATNFTLMPYNYFRLSNQSGYGAGNHAPAYFELMWEHQQAHGSLQQLPTDYLSRIARVQREHGSPRSTAEVIEGVRLAGALANLKDASQPTLYDLRDAATVLIGRGSRDAIAESMARVEVGTRVGSLPDGSRQTSIQLDFNQKLKTLKLEKFRSPVTESLKLDLRENRRASSEQAAYLDLNRSFFLHRLQYLGIGFGRIESRRDRPLWVEEWHLSWQPENEIELVEAIFLGDTIEQAIGLKFGNELDTITTVEDAAALIWQACLCGLPAAINAARNRLQSIAASTNDFTAIARATHKLGRTIKYGDVRKLNLITLRPLLSDLYHQAVIQLASACQCDNAAARGVAAAMADLHATTDDHHQLLDEQIWLDSIHQVALRDDINSFISGYGAALLLERNALDETLFEQQVALRLSTGTDADLGANWFEGLVSRNRQALLSRLSVWRHVAEYVAALDDEEFRRALVFLRRALGRFSAAEKRHVAENLGEIWQRNKSQISEALDKPLSVDEQQALNDLQDMDFDDL